MLIVALAMGGVIPLSENPAIGPGTETFIKLGAKSAQLIKQGQIWRFITPIFLHAGILHLLVNLIAQVRTSTFNFFSFFGSDLKNLSDKQIIRQFEIF